MNILTEFLNAAPRYGARDAIVEGRGRTISYDALARASGAVAAQWARRGIGPGDRVLVAMPLGIDLYIGLAALWRLGAVAVLPEPAMGVPGVRHAAQTTAPKAFMTGGVYHALRLLAPEIRRVETVLTIDDGAGAGDPLADVSSDAPALISFTSGSTGAPKAIVRSHGFLAAQNAQVRQLLLADGDEGPRDLVAFPVFVVANLALGATSVLPNWNLRRHDLARAAHIAAHIARHRVRRALIPPSIAETLARAAAPAPLDAIFTGGGPIFPDLIERLTAGAPSLRLTCVYGSTEAEPIAHLAASDIAAADWSHMKSGGGLLAGPPVDAIKLQLRNDEILVAGEHVNKGYLDPAQDASTKLRSGGEIWHRTGDAGRMDASGRLWLLGRHSARVGGLYPFMIEAPARFWPGVRRAALTEQEGCALLVVEGDNRQMSEWRRRASAIGDVEIFPMDQIPLDRRHRSKVDTAKLRSRLVR